MLLACPEFATYLYKVGEQYINCEYGDDYHSLLYMLARSIYFTFSNINNQYNDTTTNDLLWNLLYVVKKLPLLNGQFPFLRENNSKDPIL